MESKVILSLFSEKQGIFRLIPVFVPRPFSSPGRRLRLHPDDYYAFGTKRGAIKERWFSSTVRCNNGPMTTEDEGVSYVHAPDAAAGRFTLSDAIDALGADLVGKELMDRYGTWPIYAKFFDYSLPLFHHLHLSFEHAARIGVFGKPECYYFPPQYNNHAGSMPVTYFGFDPGVTKEQVRERLLQFRAGDNRITELSRAYRIELGTGWYTPAGVVHAPGSYLTYEPQWNSDVNSVYENVASGEVYGYEMLVDSLPPDERNDIDAVMNLMDWQANVDPFYRDHYFRPPVFAAGEEGVYNENWVVYKNPYMSAKELTIYPGQSVIIRDSGAYGCILTQGYGRFGPYNCETAGMLRFGQLSADEYFVSAQSADRGICVTNLSEFEPLVMLKHFGPHNPDTPM